MEIDKSKIKIYLDNAIKNIMELIKIKSIPGKKEKDKPFGKEKAKALDYVINLAKSFGFKTYYGHNNEYGYAEYGNGEKIFAIGCHLDVVPEGSLSEWIKDPWKPIIKDGYLFGRGSIDNKGPTIINLYACKYLIDHNWKPKEYKIRFIFGLTEETTWESINSYLKHEQKPDIGYIPDGLWPCIYAEKGIINFNIKSNGIKEFLLEANGAYNVVNDLCKIKIKDINKTKNIINFLNKNNYDYELKEDMVIIKGKSSHASMPETGINAIVNAAKALYNQGFNYNNLLKWIVDNFENKNHNLNKILPNWKDETGKVTASIGKAHFNETESKIYVECRIPLSYSKEQLKNNLKNSIKKYNDLTIDFIKWNNPIYIDPKSKLIQNMLSIYKELSKNKDAKPLAIGGGTYARAFENCFSFGACEPKTSLLMHNVNERIKISELNSMLQIYIKAIEKLVV